LINIKQYLTGIYLIEINKEKKEEARAAARASWLALDQIEAASAWLACVAMMVLWLVG
jgi:hypothetical protein